LKHCGLFLHNCPPWQTQRTKRQTNEQTNERTDGRAVSSSVRTSVSRDGVWHLRLQATTDTSKRKDRNCRLQHCK